MNSLLIIEAFYILLFYLTFHLNKNLVEIVCIQALNANHEIIKLY